MNKQITLGQLHRTMQRMSIRDQNKLHDEIYEKYKDSIDTISNKKKSVNSSRQF